MRVFPLLIPLLFILFTASCGREEITSLTAAGLKEPFVQLVEKYKGEHPSGGVNVVFAGSGNLLVKLENRLGDLYIPASYSYMEEAVKRGLIDPKTVKILAYHRPVLVVRKPFAGKVKSLEDLLKVDLKIGIADPKEAAIGRATYELLKKAHLWEALRKKIVVKTATVNQLLLYLKSGAIDAAIVWGELAHKLKGAAVVELPPSLVEYEPIPVGIATFTKNREAALEFEKYLLQHREVFKHYGFSVSPEGGENR